MVIGNLLPSKEADGPYAWRYIPGARRGFQTSRVDLAAPAVKVELTHPNVNHGSRIPKETNDEAFDNNKFDFEARLEDLRNQASSVGAISFLLPKADATAGVALQHSIKIIEKTMSTWKPMIFKVGITHDPKWRWCNNLYGYQHSIDKWSDMLILYAAGNPHGPAMMEAAIIEKYQSTQAAKPLMVCLCCFFTLVWSCMCGLNLPSMFSSSAVSFNVDQVKLGRCYSKGTYDTTPGTSLTWSTYILRHTGMPKCSQGRRQCVYPEWHLHVLLRVSVFQVQTDQLGANMWKQKSHV